MLTSDVWHWLRIHFRKVFISLLWEIKKTIKTLITFFSFFIKTFFNYILNQCCTALINISQKNNTLFFHIHNESYHEFNK